MDGVVSEFVIQSCTMRQQREETVCEAGISGTVIVQRTRVWRCEECIAGACSKERIFHSVLNPMLGMVEVEVKVRVLPIGK